MEIAELRTMPEQGVLLSVVMMFEGPSFTKNEGRDGRGDQNGARNAWSVSSFANEKALGRSSPAARMRVTFEQLTTPFWPADARGLRCAGKARSQGP